MSIFTRKISAIKLHAFSMYNYDKLIKQSAQKIRYVGHLSFFPFYILDGIYAFISKQK